MGGALGSFPIQKNHFFVPCPPNELPPACRGTWLKAAKDSVNSISVQSFSKCCSTSTGKKKIISLINIPGLALLSLSVEAISRSQNISLTTFHCQGDAEPGLQIPAAEPPAQSHPSIPLNPLATGVKTPWLIHSHAAVSISSHLQYICTNGEAFPFLQRVCEAQGRFPAKSFPKEISLNAGGRNKGQMKPRSRTLPDPSPHRQSRMETIQSSGSKINSLIFSPSAVLSVKTE